MDKSASIYSWISPYDSRSISSPPATTNSTPSSPPTTTSSPPSTSNSSTTTDPQPRQPSKLLTTYLPWTGLLVAPAIALLPPRKLDLYTFLLLSISGTCATELGYGAFSGQPGFMKKLEPGEHSGMSTMKEIRSKGNGDGEPASVAQAQHQERGDRKEVGRIRDIGVLRASLGSEYTSSTPTAKIPESRGDSISPSIFNTDGERPPWLRFLLGPGNKELFGGAEQPGVRDLGLGQRQPDPNQSNLNADTAHPNPSQGAKATVMGSAQEIELALHAQTLGWRESWKRGSLGWERLGHDGSFLVNFEKGLEKVMEAGPDALESAQSDSPPEINKDAPQASVRAEDGGQKKEGGGSVGLVKRLWYGSETSDWKERRIQEERRKVEEEGQGVWDLVGNHIGEAFGKGEEEDSATRP